jgi:hypothetical protein
VTGVFPAHVPVGQRVELVVNDRQEAMHRVWPRAGRIQ